MFIWNLKAPAAQPAQPMDADAFDQAEDTKIYWLGAAGFMINARGTILILDPVIEYLNGNEEISELDIPLRVRLPIQAHRIPRADAVFYTHSDDDHLGLASAHSLEKQTGAAFYGPAPVFEKLARAHMDLDRVVSCRSGDVIEYPNVKITVFPADHPWQLQDPFKHGKPFRAGDSVGFIIETTDVRMFFPGDTRLTEEHLGIENIQFLALDVSYCTYHINPLGAAMLANILKEAELMPYHYGTFDAPEVPAHCGDPGDVAEMIDGGSKRVHIMPPGEPMIFRNGTLQQV